MNFNREVAKDWITHLTFKEKHRYLVDNLIFLAKEHRRIGQEKGEAAKHEYFVFQLEETIKLLGVYANRDKKLKAVLEET